MHNVLEKSMNEGQNKSFWKYVKAKRKDNIGVAGLRENGTLHQDSKTKAELLNNQFRSVFTREDPNEPLPPLQEKCYPDIGDIDINTAGVAKLLKNLNEHKACGPDSIPNYILKHFANELAPAITDIFDLSIKTGSLPSDWRNANISPVYKKGNKHIASNYRPVSLTSVCCKTLEHIICKQILCHLEQHKILTSLQHGFRSGHSCESQLVITMHDLMQSFDRRLQTDMIILDFSKAFDTVPHQKLLYKLGNYGIKGNIHKWISAFLTQRKQQVVIDGISSTSCSVDSGVPQGTVLGPLLFLCHINDLPLSVSSQVRLFADDCLIYRNIKTADDQKQLQDDLSKLEDWAHKWGMRFNATKCYLMIISRSKSPWKHNYTLDNHTLEQVSDNPYLGITISDNLKWHSHISKTTKKANSILGFIRRILRQCHSSLKETAYKSLIRSILDYSAVVWDPYLKGDIQNIENIQRRAARFVKNDYSKTSSVTSMLRDLKWQPLAERRRDQRLCLLFKIISGLVAIPTEPHIAFNPHPSRNRNSKSICVYSCNSDIFKNSFFPRTILDWNTLPEPAVLCKSSETFRTAISPTCD